MTGLIPYIGGKHRIAKRLAEFCRAMGADLVVDVFGGSAAVSLACAGAGFHKRIYNDIDGDLVNLFRVISDRAQRRELLRLLRWTPPSRQVFRDDYQVYLRGAFSFRNINCPVQRARATFYRHHFSFGGKVKCGGFSISVLDRHGVKEAVRYRNAMRRLAAIGEFFRDTVIEQLHFAELITLYGDKPNCVLFVDPPYFGTEQYYSQPFGTGDHVFLANQLAGCRAAVVATYYDAPLIRELYPEPTWNWSHIQATKNSQFRGGQKAKTLEFVITKPSTAETLRQAQGDRSRVEVVA